MYLLSWKLSWDILSENSQVQNRLVCSHLYKNIGCIHREVYTHLIRKLTKKKYGRNYLLWFLWGMETENVR